MPLTITTAILALATVAAFLLFLIETAAYVLKAGWYYRFGPTLRRERWQTRATTSEARGAIRQALRGCGLAARMHRAGFAFRRPMWTLSAWPRVFLRIEEGSAGAILVYEVRPFVSMALMAVLGVGWILANVDALHWSVSVVAVAATYAGLWRHDLRALGRLRGMRAKLRDIGLRICTHCGYDRYGQAADRPCSECGAVEEEAGDFNRAN